jgi:hypothetical protein
LNKVWPTFSTNPLTTILSQDYARQWPPWTVSTFPFAPFFLLSFSDITVEGIRAYRLPQETEDYTVDDPSAMDVDIDPQLVGRAQPEAQHSAQRSNLRLFPPPIFSRQGISQNYKYVDPGPSNTLIYVSFFYGRGSAFQFQGKPNVHRYYCLRRENRRGEGETHQQGTLEGLRANVHHIFRESGGSMFFFPTWSLEIGRVPSPNL